jgi:hypothetical protein
MTTKKSSTKAGAKGKTRRALITRAKAITGDVRKYDYDTREAIAAALEDESLRDHSLAGMIEQAEAGEYVEHPLLDIIEHDHRETAHRTVRFLETGLPDWLLRAVCKTLADAATFFNIQVLSDDGDGNFSARALAELFRVSGLTQFEDIYSTDLADHLAAVLNHPDLPTHIYNSLSEAVSELAVSDAVTHRAEVLRVALEVNAKREGGE